MNIERNLDFGLMTKANFDYQEFESLLGLIHNTLKPLVGSEKEDDVLDFKTVKGILEGFTKRHSLMSVDKMGLKFSQTENKWRQSGEVSCIGLGGCLCSIAKDFGIGVMESDLENQGLEDVKERVKLFRVVERVLERYEGFKPENENMTLKELVVRKKSN